MSKVINADSVAECLAYEDVIRRERAEWSCPAPLFSGQLKSSVSCAKSARAGLGRDCGGAPSWRVAFQRLVSSFFHPLGGGHGTPQAASCALL